MNLALCGKNSRVSQLAIYSTVDHVFALDAIVKLYLHSNKSLYCAFIEYKHAFDSIDRVILWQKLLSNNIGGSFLNVVYNLYSQAKSKVKVKNVLSLEFFRRIYVTWVSDRKRISHLFFRHVLNDLQYFMSKKYSGLTYLSDCVKDVLSDHNIELQLRSRLK